LLKPVAPELLRSKVSVFVELHRRQLQIEQQAALLRAAEEERVQHRLAKAQREHDAKARAAAEEALLVREEFLTVASHEFKTPLTALQLAVQGMRREAGGANRQLELVERQVMRLARLVDQLTQASGDATMPMLLELAELDLVSVARRAMARAEPEAARSGATIALEAAAPVCGRFDGQRLERVLGHLLDNALRFGAGKPIRVEVAREGNSARLRVQDFGIGIETEDLPRIFGRFERAVSARAYGGFGLGLYLSRRIVEAHGGAIAAESEPGKGATFTVTLPL
jgi:signal transduction histidine kinase